MVKMMTIAFICCCLQFAAVACSSTATTRNITDRSSTTTLHLLALVPMGIAAENSSNCLDFGEQMLPAAEIAAEKINDNPEFFNNSSIRLEIIKAGLNRCLDPSIATSLASLVRASNHTNTGFNIVGIIGLVCPSSLLSLSPIASLPGFKKLHISSSTTPPEILNTSRIGDVGLLYQIAPSTSAFNEAVVALMKTMSWRNISLIRHTDIYSVSVEHDQFASDFNARIIAEEEEKLSITLNSETGSGISQFVQDVKLSGVRIVYTSVTLSEARELLCQSYSEQVMWPNYLWIFYDHSLKELLHATTDCSLHTMEKAVEGILLLYHDVSSDEDREIDFTGYTYGEYLDLYTAKLAKSTTRPVCNKEPQILSANALHDSVLAFAYALNTTLRDSEVGCLGELGCNATDTLNSHIQSANFAGAGGKIAFDDATHELTANARVNIYQVLGGVLSFLTQFNGSEPVTINTSSRISNFSYTFSATVIRIPILLPVLTLAGDVLIFAVAIIIFILFIHYRESPDIKATSPLLSYIILFSCVLLLVAVGGTAIRSIVTNSHAYAALCASEQVFFALGVQLIFATLCIRLLRVSRIFFNFDPVGQAWSDRYLAGYVGISALITVFLVIIWLSLDDFTTREDMVFLPDASPPHYSVTISCSAERMPIFISLIFGYIAIFVVVAIVLAIKTRKVHIDVFRDTKSVNGFIFCSAGILSLLVTLSFITANIKGLTYMIISYLFLVTSLMGVAVACLCFLFIPKIHLARTLPTRPRTKSSGSCSKHEDRGVKNAGYRSSNYSK